MKATKKTTTAYANHTQNPVIIKIMDQGAACWVVCDGDPECYYGRFPSLAEAEDYRGELVEIIERGAE